MSFEYEIHLDNKDSLEIIKSWLKASPYYVSFEDDNNINLRDYTLNHSWSYDIRFHSNGSNIIFMVINNFSKNLFITIRDSLMGYNYQIIDDDEEVSLEYIFRSCLN